MKYPVLVTGGAGCIGIQVCRELVRQGMTVHLLDLGEQISRVHSAIPEGVKIFYGSVLDVSSIREAMMGCKSVVHLAAMLGVRRTESNRLRCLEVNIQGTKRVLDCAIQHRIEKFVFASSSEVYGEPLENPITEEAITQGKTVYAISKLAGEELCKGYAQQYASFSPVILRIFNTFGPYQAAQFAIPRFIMNALSGISLTINGSGKQTRSYSYSSDTARGIVQGLVRDLPKDEIVNLGNDAKPISLEQLAQTILSVVERPDLEIRYARNFADTDRTEEREIYHRYCSGEKARKLLGFVPTISLEEGIAQVAESNSIFDKWESSEQIYYDDELT
jgi:UDP-glucose 4-epimerase